MRIRIIIYTLLLTLGLGSCTKEEVVTPSNRTVLVYMVASDLGSNLEKNISDMIAVADGKNLNGGNLIVFYSTNKDKAELFQIKAGKDGIITRHHIRDYSGRSAISPEVMKEVIEDVRSGFPSDCYGMILSSHGTAWMPSNYSNMLRSFGEENRKNMEIYELAEALPDHLFDFLLFDACSMGAIECVYELRDKADYIIASPSETMRAGFPFLDITPYLFTSEVNYKGIANAFYNFYMNYEAPYGNIAVTKTSELENMASIIKEILSGKGGEEAMYSLPYPDLQTLSNLPSSPTKLSDFGHVISKLATEEQYNRFTEYADKTILNKYYTKNIYCTTGGVYTINYFSGLSIYTPQEKLAQLNEWYRELEWYKAVYK